VPTCYPNTSCTRNWASNKVEHHDLHPKLCRNPLRVPTLHPKPSGAPLASLGGTWLQTIWQASLTTRRQAPSNISGNSFHLVGLPYRQASGASNGHYHCFCSLSFGGSSHAARRHTSSTMLLVAITFEKVPMNPQTYNTQEYSVNDYPVIILMTGSLCTHLIMPFNQLLLCKP